MKAVAKRSTVLTKESVDSSLALPGRIFEVNEGSEFILRALAPQINAQGKRMVTFSTSVGPQGFNTWFLFPAHWDIEGEPRADYLEATSPKAAKESTPVAKEGIDWWDNKENLISRFFAESDVTNGDERRIPEKGSEVERAVLAMAAELDKIRQEWGHPIGVTSWNRPYTVNREVGGVSNSQHITGGAVDVYTLDDREYEFEDFLDRHWGGGLGFGVGSGRGFTHLDLREGGWRRGAGTIRWSY
jgi:Peptidase M15